MEKTDNDGKYDIYIDGDQLIKVGPHDAIRWEAHILEILKGIHGIPQVRDVTTSMGHAGSLCLVMDLMPGQSLLPLHSQRTSMVVLASLYGIITTMYMRGVCHMRILPEHIMVTDEGLVSLVGFSGATVIDSFPIENASASPDFIGIINKDLFKLSGPYTDEVQGGFKHIIEVVTKKDEEENL